MGRINGAAPPQRRAIAPYLRSQDRVLVVNVAKPEKLSRPKDQISQRILPESMVLRMLHGYEGSDRNRAILFTLYATGLRASELCGLSWGDCQQQDDGNARVTVHGKGNKTRVILVGAEIWGMVAGLRGGRSLDSPVFVTSTGKRLSYYQVYRVVQSAARQVGLEQDVSPPHWLRHAHASHSLKRGAPLNLVQDSLGHASLDTTKAYLHADPGDSSGLYLGI